MAPLVDRIAAQLEPGALARLEPRESHLPERASIAVPIGKDRGRSEEARKPPRPVRLFQPPEPVEAFWMVPDDPPFHFSWRRRRHRVAQADGPERVAEEWWRPDQEVGREDAVRDYYRVEDEEGRRFWLFRAGLPGYDRPPRWYVHGVFA